jgi:hypothetical protein
MVTWAASQNSLLKKNTRQKKDILAKNFRKRLVSYYPRVKKRNRYTHDHILGSMAFSLAIHISPKNEIKKRKIGFILILDGFQSSSKVKGKK